MTPNACLKELKSVDALNEALAESHRRPVLLFKHSATCPLSTRALDQLQSYLDDGDSRISYLLVTVQTARAVSDEAALRLRVTHQSPQAILICSGREVWNASHSAITASTLKAAISGLG